MAYSLQRAIASRNIINPQNNSDEDSQAAERPRRKVEYDESITIDKEARETTEGSRRRRRRGGLRSKLRYMSRHWYKIFGVGRATRRHRNTGGELK